MLWGFNVWVGEGLILGMMLPSALTSLFPNWCHLRCNNTDRVVACLTEGSSCTVDPDAQSLIGKWSHQESTHAIEDQVPWLFIQLPRGVMHHGRAGKRLYPSVLPHELQLPFFTGAGSFDLDGTSMYM